MNIRNISVFLLFCNITCLLAQVPSQFTRIHGPDDLDIPTPVHTNKTVSDGAALQSVLNFVTVSGVTGFLGLTAHGTISFAGDTNTYPATLSILGSDRYRLDVTRSSGIESTIYNGTSAVLISDTGKRTNLSSDLAVAGLVSIPRLLSPNYPKLTSLVTDGSLVSIGNSHLHKITLEDPATDVLGSTWKVTDLYFDPATNTLVRSVSAVHLTTRDPATYVSALLYEDYRNANHTLLPFRFTQTLNGDLLWKLQLSDINLFALPDSSLFTA